MGIVLLVMLSGCNPNYEVEKLDPVLQLSTSVIDFNEVVVGKQSEIGIAVDNVGRGDLIIDEAVLDGTTSPDFQFVGMEPMTIDVGGSGVLTVRYVPSEVGQDYGRVALTTNDPEAVLTNVDLMGFGVEPHINLAPDILFFGDVAVGETKTLDLEVSASGTGTTFIDDIEIDAFSDLFTWTLPDGAILPYPLPASFSFILPVTFAPSDTAEVDTNLVFTSNDPAQPTAGVRLLANSLEDPTKNTPPTVEITAPDWGNYIVFGDLAVMAGTAVDIEDGPEMLVCGWSGGGKNLGVVSPDGSGLVTATTSDLPVGDITISLRCMDTEGEMGEDSIQVTVWDPDEPIQYVISGGDTVYDYFSIDDDINILVDGVPIFSDTNRTQDNVPPVEFQAKKGSVIRIQATDVNPNTRSISALQLHFGTGSSQVLNDALCVSGKDGHVCYDPSYADNVLPYVFLDESYTIDIP